MPLLQALSFIGGVAVTKFIEDLIDRVSAVLLPFPTERNVHKEIQKLEAELKKIRTVLDDAEERQMKEQPVKDWLTDLQNLAYDVEDVVDEFATEIGQRNLMMERRCSSSKRPRLNPDSIAFNSGMMSKIKELTAKLKDLKPQMDQLQLKMDDCGRPRRPEARLQPTSVEIEPHVFGRDNEKKTILDLLLRNEDERSFVIPIVGMGGIGKTTLAQLIYNDASIQNHFHLKAWVCVSEDFDVGRITKEILKSVTSKPCDENDLNKLQEMLKKVLSHKKFLIVLDDVWNENYHDWTILKSPFLTGTLGSKIIVTTRNHRVSSTMGAFHAHSLEVLSDDDCMSVFSQHAWGARDFGGHPNLKEVAEKIVRKCNGLPLAAKTLGGLLRSNVDLGVWEDISESEIWKLSEHQCGIIPALQLSYHHLPPHLKRCFAYCSIIPKGYEFEEEEIILLWRAQGFLQQDQDRQCIEDLGSKYFKDLVSRSLLQISVKDSSRFVMHDLINDLAQSVSGAICFKIDGNQQISKSARHLSYIAEKSDGMKKFEGLCEVEQLRTFLPFWLSIYEAGYLTNHVLTCLLPKLRWLRVLSLKGYQIEELSDFLRDLKHLRYLNFSNNGVIKSLPESVSTLYNLETLLLKGCKNLERLPSEMEKLVNLCYLDIRGADRLEGMPCNFSTLTNLQTLSMFVLGKGKGYQIRELKDLSNLKGQLCISGLENIVEPQDAWTAKLHDKSRLERLELKWSNNFPSRRHEVKKKVLDALQPPKSLKELCIKFYCGAMLANWVAGSSFTDLQSLCLDDCPNLFSLPSIGTLPLLKNVCIKGLKSVTSVGLEFFGENTRNPFPALELLEFSDMPKWENWNLGEEARKFPRLREFVIENCPVLLGSIPEALPSLEKLMIRGCKKLIISIQNFPVLSEVEIERCEGVVYKGFTEDSSLKRVCFSGISKFTSSEECLMSRSIKVESLEINNCEELCYFQENNWGRLTQSMSIGVLSIRNCQQVLSIGAEEEISYCSSLEKLSTTLNCLTSLRVIKLLRCPKLKSIARSNLPLNLKVLEIADCYNLESLMLDEEQNINSRNACVLQRLLISYCESLKRINRSELPSTLKQLTIIQCSKLESIAQEIQDNSSLESIYIDGCDMIKELPQGLNKLKHLQRIEIRHCSNLICFPKSGLPTTNLKTFFLGHCQGLQALPDNMPSCNSLERLVISNCPNVTSFPEECIPNPTNLRSLGIGGANICKLIMEFGLHRLTSLEYLNIANGCLDAMSFPQTQMLPSSLTSLIIKNFPNLEILSSDGFRNLTSLKFLYIFSCPNLKSLPEKNMLSSLLELIIKNCPVLKVGCKREEGPEWSKISHIPFVDIDNRNFIYAM